LEALKDRFKDVMEAYDVLSDEERRGSWERLRQQVKSGGSAETAKRTVR
jgi:DnaJ-class molecular chaperone